VNKKIKSHLKQQRGIAMIVALLALVLLAAIGMALMFMADTENSVNNNYRDSQKAYFAARAGAEQARLLLATDNNINAQALAMDGVMPTSGTKTGILYLYNPTNGEAVDPTKNGNYVDNQICWEKYAFLTAVTAGTGGPCGSGGAVTVTQLLADTSSFTGQNMAASPGVVGADALPFKWVRITNKQNLMGPLSTVNKQWVSAGAGDGQQICWDGSQEVAIPLLQSCTGQKPQLMPVWELTSMAVTPAFGQNPGSRRIVQMEVAFKPPLIPPAPISTQTAVKLQGSFVLNAYDFCTCQCTTPKTGPTTCNAGCNSGAHAIFTSQTVTQVGNGTTISSFGSDPTGSASLTGQTWPNSLNINNLINQYRPGASIPGYASSCTGTAAPLAIPPTYLNCGTQTNQTYGKFPASLDPALTATPTEPINYTGGVTEYIPGSVKLTAGATGGGILIVDGDLQIDGGLNWYGLILVRGQVSFTGGAGGVNLYGAILAGQNVSATDQTQGTDTFGGSLNLHYDVCALNNSGKGNPPQLLATHEIMY
jgi:hypothetical protein